MSRAQRLAERRRRMAAQVYNHQAELARIRGWLLTHHRRSLASQRR